MDSQEKEDLMVITKKNNKMTRENITLIGRSWRQRQMILPKPVRNVGN